MKIEPPILKSIRQPVGPTTFDSFNDYIDKARTILDVLLKDWSILEIVDLLLEKRRHFYWKPEKTQNTL